MTATRSDIISSFQKLIQIMLPFPFPLSAFRLPVLPGLLDACLCEQAWFFCRGVLEFSVESKRRMATTRACQ